MSACKDSKVIISTPIKRAQHRFGGMLGESKNEGGIQDDRTFNCVMRDKNIHWEQDLLILKAGCGIALTLTTVCG